MEDDIDDSSEEEIEYFDEFDDDVYGKNDLQMAVLSNDREFVMAFIATNGYPAVDAVSPDDRRTPLTLSCYLGQTEHVKALLEAGADVNGKPSNEGMAVGLGTPMGAACYGGRSDCLELLLKAGVSANMLFNEGGMSPLLDCCTSGNVSCVKTLISYGADINFQESSINVSCVQRCCTCGNTECLDILLRAGANTEQKDHEGDRPMQQAVISHQPNCLKLLIAHGANLYTRNDYGKRPIDIQQCDDECGAILKFAMNNPMSLKQWCRLAVRWTLGATRLQHINSMMIPQCLKVYLNFGMCD